MSANMTINKIFNAAPVFDLLEGCDRWEINVDKHYGIVALVDVMPRMVPAGRTADSAIVQAARTSTGKGISTPAKDRALIRRLYRDMHTSPFEMVEFKFHQVLPIFVARQLIRHRTANVNEYSLRYAPAKDRFWFPDGPESIRAQSLTNKQHTEGGIPLRDAAEFIESLHEGSEDQMTRYRKALEAGVGRELARTHLPVNLYTEWYWKIDLNNLLKLLGLRQDKHAQAEIRVYAEAMYELIKGMVPESLAAYDDYHVNRGAVTFSTLDIRVINGEDPAAVYDSENEAKAMIEKCDKCADTDHHALGATGPMGAVASRILAAMYQIKQNAADKAAADANADADRKGS